MRRLSQAVARPICAVIGFAALLSCGETGTSPGSPSNSVASVEVIAPPSALLVNETFQLTAVARNDAGGQPSSAGVKWSSSNDAVAIVSQGLVTARGIGTAEIVAESGGKIGSARVTVLATQVVVSPDRYLDGTIAFTSTRNGGSFDVYVVGPGGLQRVTSSDDHEQFDSWSPDALRIAFIRFPVGTSVYSSHVINTDGSNDVVVAQGLVTWAPDWRHRGLVSNGRLVISNADGSNPVAVSPPAPAALLTGPWWSSDGSKLAFAYSPTGASFGDVYTVNRDGSGLRNVTNTPDISEEFASWSADGSKLAITGQNSTTGLGGSVFVVNADGTGLRQVTNTTYPNADAEPEWSPDGKLIAYTSNVGQNYGIFLVNPLGGSAVRLTPPSMIAGFGNWSHDGTRLTFTGIAADTFRQDIFVMTIDRKTLTQITRRTADNLDPFWKP